MYCGYVVAIQKLYPHSNADRLQCAEIFGNQVIVGLDVKEGDVGVFFPVDGKLGFEYASKNNLIRKKDENGVNVGGYLESNCHIRALRLRGEKSEGLFMPITSLNDFTDTTMLHEGDQITVLNGTLICEKFIPPYKGHSHGSDGSKVKKAIIAPLFSEHADTEQLNYNLNAFHSGDQCEITLKMHGTSGRTGYLPIKIKQTLLDKLLRRERMKWGYVTGTRRTVISDEQGEFSGSDKFRETQARKFEGKLWKGETIYYEIVGYADDSTTIMGIADNKKVGDKEFTRKYGDKTIFSYGCKPGECETYVYRMTMTNEDGDVVEYTPDFMRYRCEQIGVNTVPVFYKGYIATEEEKVGEWIKAAAETYYDGEDPIGKTHIREGVVVRIVNKPTFKAYKSKNFNFKLLEGIIKETADAPDMEEAQEEYIG